MISYLIDEQQPFVNPAPLRNAPKLTQFVLPDIVPALENTIYPQVGAIIPIMIAVVCGWKMLQGFGGGH